MWFEDTVTFMGNAAVNLSVTSLADMNNRHDEGFIGVWEKRQRLVWYCRKRQESGMYTLCWESAAFPSAIVSTVVVDLNRDGKLDLLVQCTNGMLYFADGLNPDSPPTAVEVEGMPMFNTSIPQISLVTVKSQCGLADIALVDTQGSLVLLSGKTVTSEEACVGGGVPSFTSSILVQGKPGKREVVPLSIASEDIDGDCTVDVMYTVYNRESNALEIFSFSPRTSKHELLITLGPAQSYGFPSFADINGDGAPDLIVPMCASGGSARSFGECSSFDALKIYLNDLLLSTPCTSRGCCSGHPYGFNEKLSSVFSLKDNGGCSVHTTDDLPLVMPSTTASPLLLRFGDCNRDGYADLVVPSSYGPLVLTNTANFSGSLFTCAPVDNSLAVRTAKGFKTYREAIPFFVTVADKGRLDIVLTHHGKVVSPLKVYLNRLPGQEQNYYLTSSALNGVANGDLWGVYQPVTVHRFGWNDINMKPRWAYGVQLSRTQGHALQSSRLYFGLGRTFSYIHDYTIGASVSASTVHRRWSANLIPNSNVFAWLHPLKSPGDWHLQLYLAFATYKKLLLIVLGTTLVLLGPLIALLKLNEIWQDRREWKQR
ncbi:hypothetical protein ERJ75_001253300 [Trypanosoma vivax]|nr:putative intergrin alpha chain protein [Trypanosoma vivax]KAH8609194.1 hypothetical protein ERJ75_001253300 [Trypanosoma vivax]